MYRISDCMRSHKKPEVRSIQGLATETRGAVLLMAVFMAIFLVEGLRVLIGMGNTILQHEQLMHGADGTAFAAAVYHARGMNIIVLLNLIMAALVTIVIICKMLLAILAAALALCLFVAVITWGATSGLCPPIEEFRETVQSVTNTVVNTVNPILEGITTASTLIAYGMPEVAEVKAVYVASHHYKGVSWGFMLSPSLIPGKNCMGLPVYNAPYYMLCERGGENVADMVLWPVPGGAVKNAIKSLISGIVAMGSVYFCDDKEPHPPNADPEEQAMKQKRAACQSLAAEKKKAKKKFDLASCYSKAEKPPAPQADGESGAAAPTPGGEGGKAGESGAAAPTPGGKGGKAGGSGAAAPTPDSKGNGKGKGQPQEDEKTKKSAEKRHAKQVCVSKLNSDFSFSVFSFVKSTNPKHPKKMLQARAEFYYDEAPDQSWDQAMWCMRWRARLRPFNALNILQGLFSSALRSLGSVIPSKEMWLVDKTIREISSPNP